MACGPTPWRSKSTTNVRRFHLPLNDNRALPYREFKRQISSALRVMEACEERKIPVTVSCNKGVNRSAAVVVAYAVLVKGWTLKEALSYVEQRKSHHSSASPTTCWDTLTNTLFLKYIRQMEIDGDYMCQDV
uniref:Tyrosine specific protein phosphatases domain-containing protein n=2 Tax=Lotharella globosa TaxID=91324 RepID=A0A7S3ZCX7_9EUKA